MKDRFFGAHTIDNGGIDMAVRRAHGAGMRALQLFSAIPKFYNEKVGVKPERVERFRAALAETDILPEHVMVHAAYVLNTASSDEVKSSRARAGLAKELERSTALGVAAFCFHPGSAGDGDPDEACARVGAAITNALQTVDGKTRVLIENTAGAGRTMGRTADEIAKMLAAVPKKLRARTGYGLDTCHLFASGHDIAESPARQKEILDDFEGKIGEPPSFFHLNDSATGLGTNRDRHVLLGEGEIGVKAFEWLVGDRRTARVPLILETPQQHMDIADDDASPDPFDVRMIRLLESF